jgi:hypothetical protein
MQPTLYHLPNTWCRASTSHRVSCISGCSDFTKRDIVEVAHMEIAEPTIEQAMRNCVQRGASKVIVAPYFLSRWGQLGSRWGCGLGGERQGGGLGA